MNISHRSIWNSALGAWVAVSEITHARGKRSKQGASTVALTLICSVGTAQTIVDGGAHESVPGSQTSPWVINDALIVGNVSAGSLTVGPGSTVSNTDGTIGNTLGSTGTVVVSGAGSTWSNTNDLTVGLGGSGSLTVENGGLVTNTRNGVIGGNAGSTGTAVVAGAGSKWGNFGLQVGSSGNGTLTVKEGGSATSLFSSVGENLGSAGELTVTGPSSAYSTGTFIIGSYGSGKLAISAAGKVVSNDSSLGDSAGSSGTAVVSGAGTTWTTNGVLSVGGSGQGSLTISDGGHVSAMKAPAVMYVAQYGGSTGVVNIGAAAGSAAQAAGTLGTGTVQFGAGSGSLNFNHTEAAYSFGAKIAGDGVLNQYAGTTILTGANTFIGATNVNGGTLLVNGTNSLSTVTVNSGGTLGGTGVVKHATVASGGTLKGAAGQVLTTGDLVLNSGANVDVALGSASSAALFQVNGDLTLGGKLNVSDTGTFGSGVYRIFNYTGTLTNNGMSIGAAPAGSVLTVQTAVDKQVNLVNTAGQILNFWDGDAAGSAGNGAINGGSGTWTASSGNWTNQDGTLNAPMAPAPGLAVFMGTAGSVTTQGPLSVTGMQFASDGYTLTGDAIALSGPQAEIRVGDRSANRYTATIGAALTGTAELLKTDVGTLVLTGANTYTGGTTVSEGALALGAGGSLAATGAVRLNGSAATFDISAGGNQTIGSLSGATGSALVLGGNVLTFGDATNQTFGGVISGVNGGLVKQGTGRLTLTGASTYTGTTSINAGTLTLSGSIANSAVTVSSGGTLAGNGTVGSLDLLSGAVLAPGNTAGVMAVKGNANFAAGSIYRVEVDAAGLNDRTNVNGTAALNGGTVEVLAGAGTYAANRTYTVLNATGGRTGNFAGVTSNLAFLTPTLAYDANNVFLSLARNSTSFNDSAIAITPNQIAASSALQQATAGATGDMSTVMGILTGLSAKQARAAYDSIAGAGLVVVRGAGAGYAANFGNQLQARMGSGLGSAAGAVANSGASRPIQLAANYQVSQLSDLLAPQTVSDSPQRFSLAGGTDLPTAAEIQGRGFWLRSAGGYQNTKGDVNAAASQLRSTSISAGFDAEVREGLLVGAALSGGTAHLDFDNKDSGKSRSSALAMYARYAAGPWTMQGSASLARNDNHLNRNVMLGPLSRQANADFSGQTLSAYGEVMYSMPMGGWQLQPMAALSVSRDKSKGFTETGAGALNLQVDGQTRTSTKSFLGARASLEAGQLRLEPRVIWSHEFGDLNSPMSAQLQGAANASPFQVSGAALKRDTLIVGLGATGSIRKGVALFADVQLEHNSRQRNVGVMMGLRSSW